MNKAPFMVVIYNTAASKVIRPRVVLYGHGEQLPNIINEVILWVKSVSNLIFIHVNSAVGNWTLDLIQLKNKKS